MQVAAGYTHSLFLTKGGEVLPCGKGEDGRLGHGANEDGQLAPKPVLGLERGASCWSRPVEPNRCS